MVASPILFDPHEAIWALFRFSFHENFACDRSPNCIMLLFLVRHARRSRMGISIAVGTENSCAFGAVDRIGTGARFAIFDGETVGTIGSRAELEVMTFLQFELQQGQAIFFDPKPGNFENVFFFKLFIAMHSGAFQSRLSQSARMLEKLVEAAGASHAGQDSLIC